jgi:hypothetical protein
MYDKYDEPYSNQPQPPLNDGSGESQELISGILDKAKQYWWIVLLVFVVVFFGYFLYDFFVGSFKEVTIIAIDTEGKTVSASFRILDESGNEIKTIDSGQKTSLKKGVYYIDGVASGFKGVEQEQIEVENESSLKVVFEKDFDVRIDGVFPQSFITGEEKKIPVTFTNNGSESVEVVLLLEGDAKKSMDLQTKSFLVYSGTQQETIVVKVKTNPENSAVGENKNGVIRIQGLGNSSAKIEGKYSLSKFDPVKDIEIRIDGYDKEVKYQNIRAGEDAPVKSLRIQNKSNFEIQHIQIILDITETEFSEKESVKNWFSFNPSNVLSIPPKSVESVNILLKVPEQIKFPDGKSDELVSGVIIVKMSFYEKKFNLNFKVVKSEAKISVSGIQETYIMNKTNGVYVPKTGFIDIKNTGDLLLDDFDLRIDCPGSVGISWLTVSNQKTEYSFERLGKGETHKVPYSISVPNSTPGLTTVDCTLGVFYKDPSGTTRKSEVKTIITTAMERN